MTAIIDVDFTAHPNSSRRAGAWLPADQRVNRGLNDQPKEISMNISVCYRGAGLGPRGRVEDPPPTRPARNRTDSFGRLQFSRQFLDVPEIAEHAAALPVRDFTHDTDALQMRQRLVDRRRREPRGLDQRGGRRNGLALQPLVYLECRRRRAPQAGWGAEPITRAGAILGFAINVNQWPRLLWAREYVVGLDLPSAGVDRRRSPSDQPLCRASRHTLP
jgi:hypothetical protein